MTDAQALSTLLTVESFMLAVLGLIANLAAPGRTRVANLPIRPSQLALMVASGVGVLALGAVLCWAGIYVGGSWLPIREIIIASVLLTAVLFQPALAVLMALGMTSRK